LFDYTTSNLLQAIRDLNYVGLSVRDWPDDKIIRLLNREIDAYLVPFIMSARREHFDTFSDTPIVAGQAAYYLPSKATGGKLRALQLVDGNGQPYSRLIEYSLEEAINYGNNIITGNVPQGVPMGYWFRGNQVVLYPAPASSPILSLRFYFQSRPSTLVPNASCIQIASFPGGAAPGFFRVGFTGTAPTAYAAAVACDLVQNRPGFDVLLTGNINAVAGTYVEFAGTQPPQLQVGDWICLADTAPVVTGAIPDMVVGCLIKKVALEITSGKADDAAFNRLRSLKAEDEKRALQFLKRRNDGDRPKAGVLSLFKFRRGSVGF